jgi:putative membrane protein
MKENHMKKQIREMFKTLCVVTTVTGLMTLTTRAEEPQTLPGAPGDQTTSQINPGDQAAKSFIKQAATDNLTQIDLANVGMAKVQNENLKAFCQEVQKDYTQANKALLPIAQRYGVTEEFAKRDQREAANKFAKESTGAEFDKKLASELLKNHQKEIANFEQASSSVHEADVKQYAENMLPKLRQHLQRAETLAREVGVDQSTISSILSKAAAVGGTGETQESSTGSGTSDKPDQSVVAKQGQPNQPSNKP